MSAFAALPASERHLIVEQVAARRGILPVIVEKDFWVCWILRRIYATQEMATSVVFQGWHGASHLVEALRDDFFRMPGEVRGDFRLDSSLQCLVGIVVMEVLLSEVRKACVPEKGHPEAFGALKVAGPRFSREHPRAVVVGLPPPFACPLHLLLSICHRGHT